MMWLRLLLCSLLALGPVHFLFGQEDSEPETFFLTGGARSLEAVLQELTDAGAQLSYRPDQVADLRVTVVEGRKALPRWLSELLSNTAFTYQEGAAGFLVLADPAVIGRTFQLFGMVTDQQSGERLIGATVQIAAEQIGTYTNEYGFYTLPAPGGARALRVTYVGYLPREIDLLVHSDTLLDISLEPNRELPQVIVTSPSNASGVARYFETGTRIGRMEVAQLGGPAGEDDPLQLARLLPGVTSGADGVGGVLIRGSEAGHNMILLDGVPVYGLSHAGGLLSIFSNQAIRRVDLYKDALPARFGGRIGGVLDVHTRDGNLYENEISVGSSLLSGQVSAEGPIKNGESSFLVTGRYLWASELLRRFSEVYKENRGRRGATDYDVHDLNLKLNQKAGERGRVYLSLYSGRDRYTNDRWSSQTTVATNDAGAVFVYNTPSFRSERVRWGNTVGALRYNHVFSDRTFGNFRLSYSALQTNSSFERYDSTLDISNEIYEGEMLVGRYDSEIRQVGMAFDGQHGMGTSTFLRFGGAANVHRFQPRLMTAEKRLSELEIPEIGTENHRPLELTAYSSYGGKWRSLYFRLGLRGTLWKTERKVYPNLSPRILLAGPVSPTLDWQLSYDRTVQPVHLLNSFVIGFPSDLWVPSTDEIRPATSQQFSGKLSYQPVENWIVTGSLYHKNMNRLISYSEGRQTTLTWIENRSEGSGRAYGLELMAQRSRGKLRGWAGYTLARSERTFDRRINQGQTFPFRYDRRHSLNLLLIYQLGDRTTITGSWRYETGLAYSLSVATRTNPGTDGPDDIPVVLERNGFRMPPNHRFDVNLHTTLSEPDSRFTHSINVGVYNIYNRHNPVYYDIRPEYSAENGSLVSHEQFYKIFVAPVVPSLSYRLTFGSKARPVFGR